MEQLLSSMLGPIARGLRDTNAFGNSGDIYTDTQYRGGPITMPAPSGGGFAANYTPIRFAPLVSLTGPVVSPATPAAPEAAAPLIRPPMMMADQAGSYEALPTYQGPPIGERLATPEGRAAELQNLSRAASVLISPLTTIPSLVLTGRTPMELMAQAMGMGGGQAAQAKPQNPFGNVIAGLRNFLFGPQQETVPLGSSRADLSSQGQGMSFAAFNDAVNAAMSGGATAEMADAAGRAALGLVAQGMDPASAVALASMTALGQVGPEMPAGMGSAPVAPQAAQTFALGDSSMGVSSTDFGFDPGGGVGAAPSSAAAGMGPGW